ncbi:hypothetical protein GCM10027062_28830 [Nocardioides hungaricus]|jgi:3-methylfumaryl-CoA hydratase
MRSGQDRSWTTDERTLFLFSLLSQNAHRIHFDRDYARQTEGHRDLLVHGPLTALLAAETAQQTLDANIVAWEYRLTGPVHVHDRLAFEVRPEAEGATIEGRAAGRVCLRGSARCDRVATDRGSRHAGPDS